MKKNVGLMVGLCELLIFNKLKGAIMKDFRKQITGCDCVPTSFINALVYLFDKREDIPNEIVQGIYLKTINDSDGTSGQEIENLCHWLSNYNKNRCKNKVFSIKAICKNGEDVDFDKLKTHVRKTNACALLSVKADKNTRHSITIFHYEKGYFYCYDSYYVKGRKDDRKGKELWSLGTFEECNLRISIDYLKKIENKYKYQSGETDDRQCVLIKRIVK